MAENYKNIITAAGEDVEREGLADTPMRAAKAFAFFTKVNAIRNSSNPNLLQHKHYSTGFSTQMGIRLRDWGRWAGRGWLQLVGSIVLK